MHGSRTVVLLSFALLLSLLALGCAKEEMKELALPEGKTAEIVFIAGDVYFSQGGAEWVKAEVGDILREGAKVRTDGNSYVELVLSSGTIFRLKDRSEIELVMLPEDREENGSLVRLAAGELLAKVKKIAYRSETSIATSSVTLGVRGTEFLVASSGTMPEGTTPESAPSDAGGGDTGGTAGGDADGGEAAPARAPHTEVLVRRGAVNARVNVDLPAPDRTPAELKPVLKRLERGVTVRGGAKLAVTAEEVERLRGSIEEAVKRGSVEKTQVETLKAAAAPPPVPLDPGDEERLLELDGMSLGYRKGETIHVSPNFDGVNDELELVTTGFGLERVQGWRLVFLDGRSKVRKVIDGSSPNGGGASGVPEKIRWNMVSSGGGVVADGSYVYELYTREERKKERLRVKGLIVVDTVGPSLEATPQDMTFSPNGDGVKDILAVTLLAEGGGAEWSCVISTGDGIVVKTLDWGEEIPLVFEWNGLGENGNVLPDGLFDIVITGTDEAGNRTQETVSEVALDTRPRAATVSVDRQVFSPNGDGIADAVTFTPYLADSNRIDAWDLIVQTPVGETARRFRGQGVPPPSIKWDGSPEKGKSFEYLPKQLPSGVYEYFLKVVYRSGVNTFSYKKELTLDNDPPVVALSVSPEIFSPDGDGENDTLFIVPTIADLTPLTSWKAVIYTARGAVFKTFAGSGVPGDAIAWDGVSDAGLKVGSAEDYTLQFDATDSGSNTGASPKLPFSTDILVIPTERGLKIQVSNIEFAFDTAELKGDRTFAILKRVVEVLKKYRKYSIVVEGHTDATGDPEYNIQLSRKRAQAVVKYLSKNGIESDRLSFEGHGSKFPVDTNDTVEGRARNRRVEFLLMRGK